MNELEQPHLPLFPLSNGELIIIRWRDLEPTLTRLAVEGRYVQAMDVDVDNGTYTLEVWPK